MKKKGILLIRVVVAMLVFSISGSVLSELWALVLMKSSWSEDTVLLLFQVGSKAITILIAFPLYVLTMRLFGKMKRFCWNGSKKLMLTEHLKYFTLAFLPVIVLYGIMIVLMKNGMVPPNALESITSLRQVIYILIFGCILMPFIEEIMFRGFMYGTLEKEGTLFAVIVSSVCFALGHNNPVNIIIGLADGVVFALLVHKTGGIKYGYIYHVILNIVGSILIPLIIQ